MLNLLRIYYFVNIRNYKKKKSFSSTLSNRINAGEHAGAQSKTFLHSRDVALDR